jgi:hypothetical protein
MQSNTNLVIFFNDSHPVVFYDVIMVNVSLSKTQPKHVARGVLTE